jgi:serine phosphatase RsbU (regulator of sigma subunit)
MFATLCMLSVEPDRGAGWIRMAGHLPPLLVAGGDVRELETVLAPPLGLGNERDWPSAQVRLDGVPGDASRGGGWSVLMFTDGLIEGRIGKGSERLGSEGLMDLIRVVLGSAPNFADDRLLDKVIDQVRELNGGDLDDDLAILCVSCD